MLTTNPTNRLGVLKRKLELTICYASMIVLNVMPHHFLNTSTLLSIIIPIYFAKENIYKQNIVL